MIKITENTFVVSDLHFEHKNIETFVPERAEKKGRDGFKSHDEWLIHNWNSAVGPDDQILCLGDFAWKNIQYYSERLNGDKYLILGNHDRKPGAYTGWTVIDGVYINDAIITAVQGVTDPLLSGIVQNVEINGKTHRLLFSHYSVYDENQYDRKNKKIVPRMEFFEQVFEHFGCDYNIHGHTHDKVSSFDRAINVSVEHLDFRPQRLKDVLKGVE